MFRTLWVHPQEDSCIRIFLYGMFTCIEVSILAGGSVRYFLRTKLQKLRNARRKTTAYLSCFHLHMTYFAKDYQCKVSKSVHHHTIQINQPTRCNNLSSLLLDVYLQLNMFRASSRQSSGAQQMQ